MPSPPAYIEKVQQRQTDDLSSWYVLTYFKDPVERLLVLDGRHEDNTWSRREDRKSEEGEDEESYEEKKKCGKWEVEKEIEGGEKEKGKSASVRRAGREEQ